MNGSSPLVFLLSYLAPLFLVVAAAAWAWPLVARNVKERAQTPKGKWDGYFNGDRKRDPAVSTVDTPDDTAEQQEPEPPRSATLPAGVPESIYDE